MNRSLLYLFLLGLGASLSAQTPEPQFSYQDRSGTTGHFILVGGKTFGPYKEVTQVTRSTSGTSGLFLVTKRDKTFIVAGGQEAGPLAPGFDPEQTYISDDGLVWAVVATQYSGENDASNQTQLWVNGKLFDACIAVPAFEYAETSGSWIATVQRADNKFEVILEGRSQGTFDSVDRVWMAPDGQYWGYVATDDSGKTLVVTQDQTFSNVQNTNFEMATPRAPHWAYGFRISDDLEKIVVDGKEYPGYLNFSGLITTVSGRHWGFTADKLTESGDFPVVVVDGVEFVGENLESTSVGLKEMFSWTIKEGSKVTTQVLTLS